MRISLIALSNIFFNPKILRFLFSAKNTLIWGAQCKNQTLENCREFIREVSKIVPEWNGHLEILSRPQVIENSRQHLLLRTDILHKTVVGCPWEEPELVLEYRQELSLPQRSLSQSNWRYCVGAILSFGGGAVIQKREWNDLSSNHEAAHFASPFLLTWQQLENN